jgi:hypothetical protein
MTEDRPDEKQWPEKDLASPPTEAGEISTGVGWDPGRDGDRRRPTTAEQAVPWLIGLILALVGIVVVLVALIFTGPEGLMAGLSTPSPTLSIVVTPSPSVEPSLSPTPEPTQRVTPPPPTFGPLEMAYLGRSASGKPFYLWRHDFSTKNAPIRIGSGTAAVTSFAWSPDGLAAASIIAGHAWSYVSGQQARDLGDSAAAIAFGDDSTTLYVLRITPSGTNDKSELLAINVNTGASQSVATVTYKHPVTFPDPALRESQFGDNGGLDRLHFTIDGYVVAWVLAAPQIYRFDPLSGAVTSAPREPVLWSPNQQFWIDVDEVSTTRTNLILRDLKGAAKATVQVRGLVSHIRWAATSNEIVFTLAKYGSNATVLQDLDVWDLVTGHAASPLTSDGLARGAEWLGAPQVWLP